jgi:hypothetical protein
MMNESNDAKTQTFEGKTADDAMAQVTKWLNDSADHGTIRVEKIVITPGLTPVGEIFIATISYAETDLR